MKKTWIEKKEACVLPQINGVDGPHVADPVKKNDASRSDTKKNVEIMVVREEVVGEIGEEFKISQMIEK